MFYFVIRKHLEVNRFGAVEDKTGFFGRDIQTNYCPIRSCRDAESKRTISRKGTYALNQQQDKCNSRFILLTRHLRGLNSQLFCLTFGMKGALFNFSQQKNSRQFIEGDFCVPRPAYIFS